METRLETLKVLQTIATTEEIVIDHYMYSSALNHDDGVALQTFKNAVSTFKNYVINAIAEIESAN